ncbi:MAG: carbohydrate ABC transporter permease [Pseudomonadota bacterium]
MAKALSPLILSVFAAFTLLPFLVMVVVSLAEPGTVYAGAVLPWPDPAAALSNYTYAFTAVPLARYLLNGVIVCGAILVLQVLVAAPAGYALAKIPFRGRGWLLLGIVLALMIPMQVPAIPLYVAMAYAGLLNTYTALVLPFIISAFALFLFRQFFLQYPDDVLDAARLDGFSELAIVWRLIVPAAWPAVGAFATISIINHWNDLYWPLVVVTDTSMMTPPLGLAAFRSSGESTGNIGALMAGGVIITAPLVVGFLFFQRALIRGLTTSVLR